MIYLLLPGLECRMRTMSIKTSPEAFSKGDRSGARIQAWKESSPSALVSRTSLSLIIGTSLLEDSPLGHHTTRYRYTWRSASVLRLRRHVG